MENFKKNMNESWSWGGSKEDSPGYKPGEGGNY